MVISFVVRQSMSYFSLIGIYRVECHYARMKTNLHDKYELIDTALSRKQPIIYMEVPESYSYHFRFA